jgi:hypothetical protein
MALPAPTAAPPSFYDNLPPGGDAAAGGPSPDKKGGDSDADEELMKGLTGVYRVLSKMGKLKKDNKEFKAGIDKIKEDIKVLVVQGLKKDPKDLDSGEDKTPAASGEPAPSGPPAAPPSQTDESHAA